MNHRYRNSVETVYLGFRRKTASRDVCNLLCYTTCLGPRDVVCWAGRVTGTPLWHVKLIFLAPEHSHTQDQVNDK